MLGRIFSIVALIFILSTNFSRIEAHDDLADMYENPGNYVYYGGASVGMSFLIDRSSVEIFGDVITAREIVHYSGMDDFIDLQKISYRYDLNEGKFYRLDSENNLIYADPENQNNSYSTNLVSAGEILYYLAYNETFFDEPMTRNSKFFIEENRSLLPLVNLPNDGDDTIWHVYNHATHEIEWWKYLDDGFRRIK